METQKTISAWGRETFGHSTATAIGTRMNVEVAEMLVALRCLADTSDPAKVLRYRKEAAREGADVYIMLVQVMEALGADLQAEVDRKVPILRKREWKTNDNGKVQHVEPQTVAEMMAEDPGLIAVIEVPGKGRPLRHNKVIWEGMDAKIIPTLTDVVGDAQDTVPGFKRTDISERTRELMSFFNAKPTPYPEHFVEPGSGVDMKLGLWYILAENGASYTSDGFATVADAMTWCYSEEGRKAHGEFRVGKPIWDPEKITWRNFGDTAANIVEARHLYQFWLRNDPRQLSDSNKATS